MDRSAQSKVPIVEALVAFKQRRVVPFDVPGHKRGKGNPELKAMLGEQCVGFDVNSMKPLDNLCHPVSVILEAEVLAAQAFAAKAAFFMVNGTTSAVQAMILSAVKQGEEIILPRNVHRSVLNALVLCGAVPVYVDPGISKRLGIALGMSSTSVLKTVIAHPGAKAVVVNNPTYYGICSDLKSITDIAHNHGMLTLADEAHGTHFYFGADMPLSAMAAGADLAAVSMHKSGGSLTQSSFLLCGQQVNPRHIRQIINLSQTTSASYLLLASLDLSRKNMALHGMEIFKSVTEMAQYARGEINRIGDFYAYGTEMVDGEAVYAFDETKLAVHTLDIGLAGIEVYDLLRDEYDIQIEFGDIGNILAYLSVGDRMQDLERLISALAEIRRRYKGSRSGLMAHEYIHPQVAMTPQDAFYANKVAMPFPQSVGRISAEFVMSYPPGIPILAPGERITQEIISYIEYAKAKGCSLTGTEDPSVDSIQVI